MKNILRKALAAFFCFAAVTSVSAADRVILPWGWNQVWTAKTMFNDDGAYQFESAYGNKVTHAWPTLYEAKAGDVYTVDVPTPTLATKNCTVEFRSPIRFTAGHTYSFTVRFTTDKPGVTVAASLRDANYLSRVAGSKSVTLAKVGTANVSASNLPASNIANACIALGIATSERSTKVAISGITIVDETEGRELWTGSAFFVSSRHYDPATNARLYECRIEGFNETLSWTLPDFDDSLWDDTKMPIGNSGYIPELQTIWRIGNYTNYWIRRDFDLASVDTRGAYHLLTCHDDGYDIYVNGFLIETSESWTTGKNYMTLEVPTRCLRAGRNVIACCVRQYEGDHFFDCSLTMTPNAHTAVDLTTTIKSLIFNEVTVANIDRTLDYSNNYGGWVELYNPTSKAIPLDFVYVSDDITDLRKHRLPVYGSVPARGYSCIYFDHGVLDGVYGPDAYKQVEFKLSTTGGTLYLSEDGVTPALTLTYPEAMTRCSYARKSVTSDEWSYNGLPTPGAANSSNFATTRLDAPVVDTDSRLFSDRVTIKISAPEGATVKYTTDGSAPGIDTGSTLTNRSITIRANVVYRFCAIKDGYLPSTVVTRTYIKNDHKYTFPIICVTTAPKNLYDDYVGVYVDGKNGVEGRGHGKSNLNMDWERPVNFEFITPEGVMAINQEATFAVSGGWSRHFAPASFKIKANKIYEGLNSLDYPFFDTKPYNKYKHIVVRNGGNDGGRVRDVITQQTLITSGFYVDAQAFQPAHVFINGSYLGLLNIREPNNRFHGVANYGYDDDLMDAFEYAVGFNQMAGTRDALDEVVALSTRATDSAVYEAIRDRIDMDEFINFMATICYVGSTDWLGSDNNAKGYRSLPDGKFHFVVMDLDFGWDSSNNVEQLEGNYINELTALYNNLRRNTDFSRRFVDAYCILAGSVFTPERCLAIGDSICNMMSSALGIESRHPWNSYNQQRDNMISTSSRNARMSALKRAYGLGNGMEVTVDANIPQASLMLNDQPIPTGRFSGTVFPPATVTASAPDGYTFVGWQGTDNVGETVFPRNTNWSYYDRGSLDGLNWKDLNYTNSWWSTGAAPLGYWTDGTRDLNTNINYGGNKSNKYPCYYFRKVFTLDEAPKATDRFVMDFSADDGIVVYVNGREVYRYLMPSGDVSFNTFATTFAPGNPDNDSFVIDGSYFVKGENIIAVEVHNNSASSTDIYWAATLRHIKADSGIIANSHSLTLTPGISTSYRAIFAPAAESSAELTKMGVAPIRINEVSAGNEIYVNEYVKRDDWIELYNTTDTDFDVAGMYLSDNAAKPQKYRIAAPEGVSTIIPAHGYLLVWASKRDAVSQLHASFKLGNDNGSIVMLTAADNSWHDVFYYDAHSGQQTYGRYPDGGDAVYRMSVPTIAKHNTLSSYDFTPRDLTFSNAPAAELVVPLAKGWNWLSHCLAKEIPASAVTAGASELRNSAGSLVYSDAKGWTGTASFLPAAESFKLSSTDANNLTIKGRFFDSAVPVAVAKGWNWLGYPLADDADLAVAMADFAASEGDLIVGQHGFAIFTDGAWTGSLARLCCGHGYMLYAAAASTFRWDATPSPEIAYAAPAETLPWSADIHAHPDIMPMCIAVEVDSERFGGPYTVAAFAGEECRGVATSGADGIAWLNVAGDSADELTFRLSLSTGSSTPVHQYQADNTVNFAPLGLQGSPSAPAVLKVDTVSTVGNLSDVPIIVEVAYYDLLGRRIDHPASGVAIRRVIYSDGTSATSKVALP